jgi:glycogen debranching enzyme
LPDHIKQRLLAHLRNPDEFWGEIVVPTVARNDPKYDPETMWRGPVWANINYFLIEALEQIQEFDLANELREKTLLMIMNQPGIYEYYNAETGKPPKKAANVFGWTAAVFIDLALRLPDEKNGRIVEMIEKESDNE